MNSVISYQNNLKLSDIIIKLNRSKSKTLFVINKKKELIGVITDGDIRRAIVKNENLKINLKKILNRRPIFVFDDFTLEKLNFLFKNYSLKAIPLLNKNNTIKKIIHQSSLSRIKPSKISKKLINFSAVIMAGGRGLRMKPFTEILPKPLIPLNGKPVLSKIIDNFLALKVSNIFISINSESDILKAFYSNLKEKKVKFIEEKKPLGTVGAIRLMKNIISDNFFITNCDTLLRCDYFDIIDSHLKKKSSLTIVGCEINETRPYGICKINNKNQELLEIIEKPKNSFIVNTGFYVANKNIIDFIPKNSKLNMDKFIKKLIEKKISINIYKVSEHQWLDVGNWKEYSRTAKKLEFEKN